MTTQARLRELFEFDRVTGELIRKVATSNRVKVGDVAGRVNNKGYRQIMVDGIRYMAHRLVWLFVHGRFPQHELDHINGIRDDNRLCNLREATKNENQQNICGKSSNKSGYLGVSWNAKTKSWRAQIAHLKVKRHIGLFRTSEEAHQAYLSAKQNLHTFHPVPRKSK